MEDTEFQKLHLKSQQRKFLQKRISIRGCSEEESVTDESLAEDQPEEETVPVTTDEKTPCANH